jgi:putative toxin-antitoxin system antitoxin component (TIGR02293 family)
MATTMLKKPMKVGRDTGAPVGVSLSKGTFMPMRRSTSRTEMRLLGALTDMDGLMLHDYVVKGVKTTQLRAMVEKFTVLDKAKIYDVLGVSERTMQRRSGGVLDSVVSAAAVELATITEQAADVLGSMEEAEKWLSRPAVAFQGRRPIDLLGTRQGADVVRNHLIRMDYGVYA